MRSCQVSFFKTWKEAEPPPSPTPAERTGRWKYSMKKFESCQANVQVILNLKLISDRNPIEYALPRLKARWRILTGKTDFKLENILAGRYFNVSCPTKFLTIYESLYWRTSISWTSTSAKQPGKQVNKIAWQHLFCQCSRRCSDREMRKEYTIQMLQGSY